MSGDLNGLVAEGLATMEADATLLESAGHTKLAQRMRRDIASLRKRVDAQNGRRASFDESARGMLREMVDDIERRLAE
ncbi:hypothetical protein [Paraburkholderia solisilvae]|uniref:Uncharacterized protein n=1 Tax=Paraburkholderia solisilvae TaxID=624376 RepID=A0A6J5DHU0_9BURK|nr:hypothetical protein [Paraburkholderia solisilvae]CAB3753027.1 hypothetical protein LMG29739_01646 [Paraburkholderia solisilvae]